jgi:hypothetical protein
LSNGFGVLQGSAIISSICEIIAGGEIPVEYIPTLIRVINAKQQNRIINVIEEDNQVLVREISRAVNIQQNNRSV